MVYQVCWKGAKRRGMNEGGRGRFEVRDFEWGCEHLYLHLTFDKFDGRSVEPLSVTRYAT